MVRSVYKQSTLGPGQDPDCCCNSIRNWQLTTNREKIIAVEISFTKEGGILHLVGKQLEGGKLLQGRSHRDLKAALMPEYGDGLGHLSLFWSPSPKKSLGSASPPGSKAHAWVLPVPLTLQRDQGSPPPGPGISRARETPLWPQLTSRHTHNKKMAQFCNSTSIHR